MEDNVIVTNKLLASFFHPFGYVERLKPGAFFHKQGECCCPMGLFGGDGLGEVCIKVLTKRLKSIPQRSNGCTMHSICLDMQLLESRSYQPAKDRWWDIPTNSEDL